MRRAARTSHRRAAARRPLIIAATACTVLTTAAARAADPTADELIRRGLELRRQSKPGEAFALFQRAHALAPSPRTLGQMGLVEASLERWLNAETHLNGSLATPDDIWVRKNRGFLDQAVRVSRSHIGELAITGPRNTEVAVNGHRAGTLPMAQPVRLAEGSAVVTASGAGFKDFSKTVTIVGATTISLAIVLDAAEQRPAVAIGAPAPLPMLLRAPASTDSAADDLAASWKRPVAAGLIAAGAGLATWGIAWIAIERNDPCATSAPSCNNVSDAKTAGWLLTAGGAVAAGTGAVLLIMSHRASSGNVALDATPTSLSLRGHF